jgi:hypothetical protein
MSVLVLASSRTGPASFFKERFPASGNHKAGTKWEQQTAEQSSP